MQKTLLKLTAPFLLLLLLFSCAKDNELLLQKDSREIVPTQTTADFFEHANFDTETPIVPSYKICAECPLICDMPCVPPDFVGADNVTATSALIKFGHFPELCGHFSAQILNESTGVWTHLYPVESPLELTGLDPSTNYTVSISHITEQQACLPVSTSFETL